MENFEPLVSQLLAAEGIIRITDSSALASAIDALLRDRKKATILSEQALRVLQQHAGATERSIAMLEQSITSNRPCGNHNGKEHAENQTKTKTEPGP
jgi:3-deoxy-D-manno-octulosonic-acid transferase